MRRFNKICYLLAYLLAELCDNGGEMGIMLIEAGKGV